MNTTYTPLSLWLVFMAFCIVVMISVGGITRLTDSGLSITQWKPITGVVPPLNAEDWEDRFSEYKASPEFIKKFPTMTMEEFKGIYLWEYGHRLIGRLVGLLFFFPFLFFLVKRKISRKLAPHLMTIFVLGGLQGVMGWYMVKSGLVDEPYVSPLRLTAHLGLALAIYAYIIVILTKLNPHKIAWSPHFKKIKSRLHGAVAFITLTILSGALVAGLDAGLVFNTFPLMDGDLVPGGYFGRTPWYSNLFADHASVQFHHRILAMISFGYVLWVWYQARAASLTPLLSALRHGLLVVVCLQVILGILTLIYAVPVVLAALHQLNAVILFTITLVMFCLLPKEGK